MLFLNFNSYAGEAFVWEEILGHKGSKRAGRLTSVLLPHLLNFYLPSFFIAILSSRAGVHSCDCILQSSGVLENPDAWSHLQEIRLNWGVAGAWGLEQVPGDAELQAVLRAVAVGSGFQSVIPGLMDSWAAPGKCVRNAKSWASP